MLDAFIASPMGVRGCEIISMSFLNLIPNPFIIPIGMTIGILVAAPVGPVNVLCIQRAIERGVLAGVVAGMGAMLGDGLIALGAALGVGAITSVVETYRVWIQLIGGFVLLVFGWHLYQTPPITNGTFEQNDEGDSDEENGGVLHWDILKTFFLTVSNPGAVLGLLTIIGGISTFVEIRGTGDALLLVGAIMSGSFIWWFGLSSFISRIRHKLSFDRLQKINIVAGLALVAFGVVLIGEIVYLKLVI